jgi:homoserine kinase
MPILTIRMSEEEIAAAGRAAERQQMSRSEFARRAVNAAAGVERKTSAARGMLKNQYSYKQAMKLVRG